MHKRETPQDGLLTWEVFLLGGGSLLTCVAFWIFFDRSMSINTISQVAFALAFAINHPHFMSSYVLLYNDFSKNIFRQARYFWAAVIVPIFLSAFLAFALGFGRTQWLGYAINSMYFLVGWHYVKQVFGCIIVTSARRRLYYQSWERRLMLGNLISLWAISFLQSQTSRPSFTFYGIVYSGLMLDPTLLKLAYAAVTISACAVVAMHLRKYIYEGVRPTYGGMVAHLSLYVWYLPTFAHPGYAYFIPLFHSLQYLAFVWTFKANQVSAQLRGLNVVETRNGWVSQFISWGVTATALGALAFELVPKGLDAQAWIGAPDMGTSPFLVGFLLFINIHHYFIDNVIWKSSNEELRQYLFAAPDNSEKKAVAEAA